MAKETTNITRYYDAVPPYCSALKISERKYESDTDKDHDVSYSKEHFEGPLCMFLAFYMFDMLDVIDMLDVFDMFFVMWTVQGPRSFLVVYIQQVSVQFVPDVLVSGTH